MIRVKVSALVVPVFVALLLAGAPVSEVQAVYVPEVAGTVQDWAPERGYLVVNGVRYELGEDISIVDEAGRVLPTGQVAVGSRVKFANYNGTAYTIVLVTDGAGR